MPIQNECSVTFMCSVVAIFVQLYVAIKCNVVYKYTYGAPGHMIELVTSLWHMYGHASPFYVPERYGIHGVCM